MIFMQIGCKLEFFEKNFFFRNFDLFLPLLDKIKHFGQNKSSRAQILASVPFLDGESEKLENTVSESTAIQDCKKLCHSIGGSCGEKIK